jgi:CO/xanthine dehydrogenase Mo-binding subunit
VAETKTHKYIGQNYVMPDLVTKVTGKARYAEDYKADGMLFAKLLLRSDSHLVHMCSARISKYCPS